MKKSKQNKCNNGSPHSLVLDWDEFDDPYIVVTSFHQKRFVRQLLVAHICGCYVEASDFNTSEAQNEWNALALELFSHVSLDDSFSMALHDLTQPQFDRLWNYYLRHRGIFVDPEVYTLESKLRFLGVEGDRTNQMPDLWLDIAELEFLWNSTLNDSSYHTDFLRDCLRVSADYEQHVAAFEILLRHWCGKVEHDGMMIDSMSEFDNDDDFEREMEFMAGTGLRTVCMEQQRTKERRILRELKAKFAAQRRAEYKSAQAREEAEDKDEDE